MLTGELAGRGVPLPRHVDLRERRDDPLRRRPHEDRAPSGLEMLRKLQPPTGRAARFADESLRVGTDGPARHAARSACSTGTTRRGRCRSRCRARTTCASCGRARTAAAMPAGTFPGPAARAPAACSCARRHEGGGAHLPRGPAVGGRERVRPRRRCASRAPAAPCGSRLGADRRAARAGRLAARVGRWWTRSTLGIRVDGVDLGDGVTIWRGRTRTGPTRPTPGAACTRRPSIAAAARASASGTLATGTSYVVDIRAFDDGVAFRFVVPGAAGQRRVPTTPRRRSCCPPAASSGITA